MVTDITKWALRQHAILTAEALAMDKRIASGININDLGFADPTRQVANTWLDAGVTGASVRQGLPAKWNGVPQPDNTVCLNPSSNNYNKS